MALLVLDPLTPHPQSDMIRGLPYLVAGLDQALHLDKRDWFLMEKLVLILGLGRYYADCIATLNSQQELKLLHILLQVSAGNYELYGLLRRCLYIPVPLVGF